MRRIAAVLITAALLSTAAFADEHPVRMITVNGKAQRHVVPDEAHIMVNVAVLDGKLTNAKTQHDQKLRKVMDLAKSSGVDEAQIRAQSSNVQPEYTYENNARRFKGYRVATNLDITVKKIDAVGGLLEKLLAAGLENKADADWMGLTSVNYTISNPDKLRDEMNIEAIKNAQEKAGRMAAAAGASLGPVYQISEGSAPSLNYPRPVPMMAMARAEMSADAGMAPPPGEQEINATVSVSYELK